MIRRVAALPEPRPLLGRLARMAAAIAGALLLLAATPARAQDAYGAIAIGQTAYGQSVAFGFAWNHAAKDEANAAAMNACRAAGGRGKTVFRYAKLASYWRTQPRQ